MEFHASWLFCVLLVYKVGDAEGRNHYIHQGNPLVKGPPFATTVPQIYSIRPDSVLLRWRAGYDGNSPIQHFNIHYKLTANNTVVEYVKQSFSSGVIRKDVVSGLIPYTRYRFRIQAVNAIGVSAWSGYSVAIHTLQAVPTYKLEQVKGTTLNDSTIEVTWEEPPRSTHNGVLRGYIVAWKYAGVSSKGFTRRKVTPASTRKIQITNLILNSSYEVMVQMFNDVGAGPFSDPIIIKTKGGAPPSGPRNLVIRKVSSRSVQLEWEGPPEEDRNGNVTRYMILFWVLHKEEIFKSIVFKHDPSSFTQVFIVTNLKPDTQYAFKLLAQNNVGSSLYSRSVQVRTNGDAPSSPPINIQLKPMLYPGELYLTWENPPVETWNSRFVTYTIVLQEAGDLTNKTRYITTGIRSDTKRFKVSALYSRTTYEIRMKTVNFVGESPYSPKIIAKTLEYGTPSGPRNLVIRNVSSRSVQLEWEGPPEEDRNGNVTRYMILFWVLHKEEIFKSIVVKHDPSSVTQVFIVTNLKPYTQYAFKLLAQNNVGSSPYSRSVQVRTNEDAPSSPPINIQLKPMLYPGELYLTWENPPVETWNSRFVTYTIVLQEAGDLTNKTRHTITGIRSHTKRFKVSALKNFTTYEIRMKTVNYIGESPYSPKMIARTLEYGSLERPCWKRRNNLKVKSGSRLLADLTGPTCDRDGYFQSIQCRLFRGCYCVNKNGKRTSRYYRGLGRSQPPCVKAKPTSLPIEITSPMTQMIPATAEPPCWKRTNKLKKKHGNRFLPELTGSRCDQEGYFKSMQCRLFRGCYCVNKNGKRTSKLYRGFRRSTPPCAISTTALPPRQSTHPTTQLKPSAAGIYHVTLLVFSGRPNPRWSIKSDDPLFSTIKKMFEVAKRNNLTKRLTEMAPRLGYKGFIVREYILGRPSFKLIFSSRTKNLEKYFLKSAPGKLVSEGLKKVILKSIENNE